MRSSALLTAFFNNWHQQYKKRLARSHRATTQHFSNVFRIFVAKAQASGSNVTEMKTPALKEGGQALKRKECETGRLIL
ncbi:hypothetical protein C3432_13790 [Citrobacter amalonaticus]|uniref:Uncharacterized protein n=1 Tax=Citrobacter amalonaticus TaxID=35703 RepID=A0A2S4RW86_CITAM|nr:hypothetical protein C3432_13790 [Citrobacter amalonaticus]POT75012.1 hypothetical protein C3436_14260 [Citrobacter amalonaticus]POU64541.1 hypothetical protein C3430_15280 [Citrobacter amalonaticus]POV04377.1 hypothetical protein C3424_14600 [Citrobacter amalonaticus]